MLAIGWLEHGHDFSVGKPVANLLASLGTLIEKARVEHSQYNFRGLHDCSLCEQRFEQPPLQNSHINLFIPGRSVIYAATAATLHYVECHKYLPPTAFLDAVESCPDYGSAAYFAALRKVNRGKQIPLQSREETAREQRAFGEKLALERERPRQ